VAGKASDEGVREAARWLFSAQIELRRSQRDQLFAAVARHKALGRVWQSGMKPNTGT